MQNSIQWVPNMISSRSFLLVVTIGTLFLADAVAAQVAPLIANISARHTTSLDGRWPVIVDPYDVGYLDYRAKPLKDKNAFFKNYKPQSGSELVEYDFDTSGLLRVPGDWNTQRDSLLFYEGSIWYKLTFNYAKRPKHRLFVHFGAANYLAIVYLNGDELGQHEGAHSLQFRDHGSRSTRGQFPYRKGRQQARGGSDSHHQHGLVELRGNYPPRYPR
jgi:hypothetical protein